MSARPVDRLIQFLRDARNAPVEQLASFAHAADTLPRVTPAECSVAAAVIATQARALVRQLVHVDRTALPALRCALLMVSDVLAMEAQAADALRPAEDQPYYLKD